MRIQHNIMAMNAYRNYNTNTSALSSNLEKLSSGYKINRAGDDAAGLAISEKMRAQISGLEQASSNVKDGISLVKTGEGAMQEVQDMLNRMVTLATQSANGTYDDATDRANLQKEVDQLTAEIDRIADSSNFNGIKLLDGTLSDVATKSDATALDNIVYDSLSNKDIQKLMLAQSTANDPSSATDGVGKKTILETDANDAQTPGFTVDLDGVEFTTDGQANSKLTLKVDGVDIDLDAATDLGLTKAGDTADGEAIADALGTKLSSGWKDTNDNNTNYNVSVSGTKVTFTLADAITGAVNKHFDTSIAASTTATAAVAAKGATIAADLTVGTVSGTGATGGNNSVLSVTMETADGETVTFKTEGMAYDATAADIIAALKKATATDSDGNTLKLTDYFSVAQDGTNPTVVFTDRVAGAEGSGNKIDPATGITLTAGDSVVGGQNDFATAAAATTTLTADGADGYTPGMGGTYVNAATQVNIQVDKLPVDQLASTTLDLGGKFTDGAQITLGQDADGNAITYTIALGEDSAYKDSDNVVYLSDAKATDEQIASKLTEVAADNATFSVGHVKGTAGKITLKQLTSAKDSTDMSTMEKFASYIGVGSVNKDASDAKLQAAQDEIDAYNDTYKDYSSLTLQIGDTSDNYNQLNVSIEDMHAKALGIADIDISTQDGASAAIDVIKNAINQVSSTRGTLGATQNRLEHTANNLSVMTENIQDAESTIRDTDIAEEMMSYTKNNILVQSAQAMLAQANSVPQGVLQLLQ